MNLDTWREYARCFSAATEAERADLMRRRLSPAVTYRDPNTEVHGHEAFAAEMRSFQRAYPDFSFDVFAVDAHHGRSVARWRLLDPAGNHVSNGMSWAIHDDEGRLQEITGYFPVTLANGWR